VFLCKVAILGGVFSPPDPERQTVSMAPMAPSRRYIKLLIMKIIRISSESRRIKENSSGWW
jgi:hypothetical protein